VKSTATDRTFHQRCCYCAGTPMATLRSYTGERRWLNGEMSEWLKEHAWKSTPPARAGSHRIPPTHSRSTTSRDNDLSRCVPVNHRVDQRFEGVCDTVLTHCALSVAARGCSSRNKRINKVSSSMRSNAASATPRTRQVCPGKCECTPPAKELSARVSFFECAIQVGDNPALHQFAGLHSIDRNSL